MALGEHIGDDMRSEHAKFHEFSMHRNRDINLSLFFFSKFVQRNIMNRGYFNT
jgi:hypothetical protein